MQIRRENLDKITTNQAKQVVGAVSAPSAILAVMGTTRKSVERTGKMSGLQKISKKYSAMLLALVLLTGAVFGVKNMEETVPEYLWIDTVPETGTVQNIDTKGGAEAEDSREKED